MNRKSSYRASAIFDGFRLIQSNGVTLAFAGSEVRVIANPNKLDVSGYRWDEVRNRIVIRRWGAVAGPMVLSIAPGGRD